MQKWDYMTLSVNTGKVIEVNGKKAGEVKGGFLAGRWVEGGTNAGLVLAFKTQAQAMAAAAALRAAGP